MKHDRTQPPPDELMGRVVKRIAERVMVSCLCMVAAPMLAVGLVVLAVIVLIPGTPLEVTYRGEPDED